MVFGLHSSLSRIERAPQSIKQAWVADGPNRRLQEVIEALSKAKVAIEQQPRAHLDELTNRANHQGVVLLTAPPRMQKEADLEQFLDALQTPPLLLVLDQVTDPHNLGACLRTADGAGVDAVIVPKDGSSPMSETVHRVASGAADNVPVFYVTNLARSLRGLKQRDIWLVGLSDSGETSVFGNSFPDACAVVMGSEGDGLRRLSAEECDELMHIPMHGTVSSLNVSVATGVVLYSLLQSRLK